MSPSADVSRQVLRHRTRGSQFMSMRRAKYAGGRPTVSGGQAERPSAATHGPPSPKALQRSQVPLGLLCVQVGFISTVLVMLCVIAVTWWFQRDIAKVAPLILVLNLAGFAAGLITMCFASQDTHRCQEVC